jgi:acyl-CoA thioesterase-1
MRIGLSSSISVVLLAAAAALGAVTPMTLVSSGKPFYVSTGNGAALFDRDLATAWEGTDSSWIAVKIGSGPAKLLLHWIAEERASWIPYWDDPDSTGSPGDYQILVSNNSTNGQDGSWTSVVTVTGNSYIGRMHSFDFTNQQWVKLTITGRTWRNTPIGLAELEIFDVSGRIPDTWFFMGNSITSTAFPNRITPSFIQDIAAAHPGYQPAMICGGHSGATTIDGINEIGSWLTVNPDMRFWCLEFGTNDSKGYTDTATFRHNLDSILDKIQGAGHVPMLARIPWCGYLSGAIPGYNAVIDDITAKRFLVPGPDFWTWFMNHQSQLKDGVHPNDSGSVAMNLLWAQAVASLYSTTTAAASPHSQRAAVKEVRISNGKPGTLNIMASGQGRLFVFKPNGTVCKTVSIANPPVRCGLARGTYLVQFIGAGIREAEKVVVR